MITLKSLTYFSDGNLHLLSKEQKERLTLEASRQFTIPEIKRLGDAISPMSGA